MKPIPSQFLLIPSKLQPTKHHQTQACLRTMAYGVIFPHPVGPFQPPVAPEGHRQIVKRKVHLEDLRQLRNRELAVFHTFFISHLCWMVSSVGIPVLAPKSQCSSCSVCTSLTITNKTNYIWLPLILSPPKRCTTLHHAAPQPSGDRSRSPIRQWPLVCRPLVSINTPWVTAGAGWRKEDQMKWMIYIYIL